ncbi:MAG: YihY/virulence factor BrkB family protein, partial [Planctomycetota bacterium]
MQVRDTLRLLKRAWKAGLEDDTLSMGASLAFYTVFSMGPVLVIATMVAAQVLGAEEARTQFVTWGERYFGPAGAKAVFNMIAGARGLRPGVAATVVGGVTLFLGATGVFGQFKRALNKIWQVKPKPTPVVKRLLLERLAALGAACGIGAVIFLGLLLSAAFTSLAGHLGKWLPLPASVLANVVLSLAIITPLFALLFKLLP